MENRELGLAFPQLFVHTFIRYVHPLTHLMRWKKWQRFCKKQPCNTHIIPQLQDCKKFPKLRHSLTIESWSFLREIFEDLGSTLTSYCDETVTSLAQTNDFQRIGRYVATNKSVSTSGSSFTRRAACVVCHTE